MTPPSDPNESRWDYQPIIDPADKVRHTSWKARCWKGVLIVPFLIWMGLTTIKREPLLGWAMLALAALSLAFPFVHKGLTGRWMP